MRIGTLSQVRAPFARSFVYDAVINYLSQLFPITAPGVTNPGFAIDYSDLTEEKLTWRRNLFSETEFRNGVADAPSRANITAASIPGYAGALQFGAGALAYAYKPASVQPATTYTVFAVFEMDDDLGPPTIGGSSNPSSDVALVVAGTVVSTNLPAVPLGGRRYLMSGYRTVQSAGGLPNNNGVLKYAEQSARTFRVTAYGLNQGAAALPYQMLTDVSTEFLAAFPYHLLFRDSLGQVACYQLEDPCGLALDAKFGGARGPQLWSNPPPVLPASWTYNGGGSYTHTPGTGVSIGFASGGVPGRTFEVSFLVSGRTAGSIRPYMGSTGAGPAFTSNGRASCRFQATGVNGMYMFADSAFDGTISEILAQEVYGDHAVQPTAGDRPTISARCNLLTATENFADTAWWQRTALGTGFAPVITQGGFAAPNGTMTAARIQFDRGTGLASTDISQLTGISVPGFVGTLYTQSIWARTNDGTTRTLVMINVGGGGSAITVTPTWQRFSFGGVASSAALNTFRLRLAGSAGNDTTADVLVWGAQTESGAVGPYQRVSTALDYDYVGFPSGARFNGINHWMQILNLNMSATDKALLFASIRKESDAAVGMVFELSAAVGSNNGSLYLVAPGSAAGPNFKIATKGTVEVNVSREGFPSPVAAVISGAMDITAPLSVLRVNGQVASSVSTLGTGNLIAANAFIGRRAGTSTPFPGMVYRLGLRGFAWDSATQRNADSWTNERLKVAF